MDNNEQSTVPSSELEKRICSFHDKLKKHLSDEYLSLSEKKDSLENEITQIKVEIEQRDRTLFPNVEKGDVRKYFSPLNIMDHEEKHKDEKEKELYSKMENVEKEISLLEVRMREIMDFFRDIEDMLTYYKQEKEEILQENEEEAEEDLSEDGEDDLVSEDEQTVSEEDSLPVKEKESPNEESQRMKIYPQMIRNLYNIVDYFKEKYPDFDILIEFNDNNIEIDPEIQRNLLNQIFSNINTACKEKAVNMVLIEGSVKDNKIHVKLSYVYDKHSIDNVGIVYNVQLA